VWTKKNNSLVSKKARVQTGAQYPYYLLIALFFFIVGGGLLFYLLDGGRATKFFLQINELENINKELKTKINELDLELDVSNISFKKVSEDNKLLKEKTNALKEDVLFYEKIVGKRK